MKIKIEEYELGAKTFHSYIEKEIELYDILLLNSLVRDLTYINYYEDGSLVKKMVNNSIESIISRDDKKIFVKLSKSDIYINSVLADLDSVIYDERDKINKIYGVKITLAEIRDIKLRKIFEYTS